ncbi:MAG: T9SS type A sorting domain-containing protein [Saprospiraceae bacterium]|nr:T9SS type A sorting domain-containing protein [Saprospiraceae bacterium]MDW8228468.1 T9SS type A sorting domain-containing protein [Saprospiraceae bacterium]
MQRFYSSRLLRLSGLLLGVLVWLANANNPPTGRTGAPFDNGSCNDCHDGGNFSGSVSISGLPATIAPNTTYPLQITLTPLGGNPNRGGYQLVVVDGNNQNAGDLVATNSQSGTEFFAGREYIEQRAPKLFNGGPAFWTFNWTSPATAGRDTIRFFFIGNFCNGNGSSSGDIAFTGVRVFRFGPDTTISTHHLPAPAVLCLYPNPATDWVRIGGSDATTTLEVELTNSVGHLIRTATLAAGEALWVGDLAPGAYVVRMREPDGLWQAQRFIRQ